MHSYIKNVTFDCADALVVAQFWAAALGTDMDEESTPEKAYVEAAGWGGPNMWFNRVPDGKFGEPTTGHHRSTWTRCRVIGPVTKRSSG